MACQLGRKTALGMAMKQVDGVYEENKYTVRFRNMLGRVASYSDVEIAGEATWALLHHITPHEGHPVVACVAVNDAGQARAKKSPPLPRVLCAHPRF
jgi:hypothetical protein